MSQYLTELLNIAIPSVLTMTATEMFMDEPNLFFTRVDGDVDSVYV